MPNVLVRTTVGGLEDASAWGTGLRLKSEGPSGSWLIILPDVSLLGRREVLGPF